VPGREGGIDSSSASASAGAILTGISSMGSKDLGVGDVTWKPIPPKGISDEEYTDRRDKQAASICKRLIPEWKEDAKCEVGTITGGITNALFKVTNSDLDEGHALKSVALRVFGDNTDLLIDRNKELSVMKQLYPHGFGAKVLASFHNGRIEEFLYHKPTDYKLCREPKFMSRIARLILKFHSLAIDAPKEPILWKMILEWCDTASKLDFADDEKRKAFDAIDFNQMKSDIR